MPVTVGTIMVLLCLFQIKHMFADYFLQTRRMLDGRSEYWHLGRAQHAGVHALGSILALLIVGTSFGFIIVLALLEWVVHFNIDYGKARVTKKLMLRPDQASFWRAAGMDQCLHQLTYVAMIWAWALYGG